MPQPEDTTNQRPTSLLDAPPKRLQAKGVEQFLLPAPGPDASFLEVQPDPALKPQPLPATPAEPAGPTDEAKKDSELSPEQFRRLQQKAQKLEKEKAVLEKENAKFKQQQAEQEANSQREAADAELEKFSAAQHRQALDKISVLDPDDADHADKVSQIWAETTTAVRRKEREMDDEARIAAAALAPTAVADQQNHDQDLDDPILPAPGPHPEIFSMQEKVSRAVTAAGFDPSDPIFEHYAGKAPVVDDTGQPMPFDAQIAWAINQTTKYKSDERSKLTQEIDQFIPRGAIPPAVRPGPAPTGSLNSALERAQERRRIT